MRKIEINGVNFELIKPRHAIAANYGRFGIESDIFDFYDRPSQYKIGIWKSWLDWARDNDNVVSFHISAANCKQFSICGCVQTPDGHIYDLRITKDHNRAYLVY